MLRKQKGVALIVALMVTIIIGIIAVSTAGLAYRGQRSQNMTHSSVVSNANAYSAATKAFKFIAALSPVGKGKVLEPTNWDKAPDYDEGTDTWTINGKPVPKDDLDAYFKGVDSQLDKPINGSATSVSDDINRLYWYRYNHETEGRPTGWNDCKKCVYPRKTTTTSADGDDETINGALAYRIEKRDFKKVNPGADEDIGYWYYRITAKGEDETCTSGNGVGSTICPQTIVQTNVAVIGVKN